VVEDQVRGLSELRQQLSQVSIQNQPAFIFMRLTVRSFSSSDMFIQRFYHHFMPTQTQQLHAEQLATERERSTQILQQVDRPMM
jgi:hypothetical protein